MQEFENLSSEEIINLQIKDVPSLISEKGLVCLPPFTPLKSAALFLIPLRELYVSGIVVMQDNVLLGRIGAKHVLQKVIDIGSSNCLKLQVKDVMVDIGAKIRTTSPIRDVLEIFHNTKFGFCPVLRNESLVGTISTRDFLPIIEKMKIELPVSTIYSDLIHIDEQISIDDTIRIMERKKIRKIAINSDGEDKIVDLRALLGYICSWESEKPNLLDTCIKDLPLSHVEKLPENISISQAAKIFLENDLSYSISEKKIITAWDLVMKTLGSHLVSFSMNDAAILD